MKELGINIIALPATCDILGMNYALMVLVSLYLGWYRYRKINESI